MKKLLLKKTSNNTPLVLSLVDIPLCKSERLEYPLRFQMKKQKINSISL